MNNFASIQKIAHRSIEEAGQWSCKHACKPVQIIQTKSPDLLDGLSVHPHMKEKIQFCSFTPFLHQIWANPFCREFAMFKSLLGWIDKYLIYFQIGQPSFWMGRGGEGQRAGVEGGGGRREGHQQEVPTGNICDLPDLAVRKQISTLYMS